MVDSAVRGGPELAEALRNGPFHRALRVAISERGLPLARLCAHLERRGLRVGGSTISYWQRGLRVPDGPQSAAVVHALEEILNVPEHALVGLIRPRRRPLGDVGGAPRRWAELSGQWSSAADLLGELDVPESRCNADLEVLAAHHSMEVGPDRVMRASTTRVVLRARRDGPDRYFTVYRGDPGCDIGAVEVREGEGCRRGRVRRHEPSGSMVAELPFDRHLAAGEVHVLSYTVVDGTGGPVDGYHQLARVRGGSLLVQFHFDPAMRPVRCLQDSRPSAHEPCSSATELFCSHDTVSAYFPTTPPGVHGITVEWD
ncbi:MULTISPECIES: hypothetical protein [Actinokineospora]|uniref:Uncharacterized protein n=1 Tax=Actinokineospora fastidiosa TaxID=1816 RepID=A0A918GFT5_9PSEU|nr:MULTISPECIES: hypothetical protein [Actinokineospora]UVS79672.1 hypothetical protein Actkin_03422 [Actinokineospora sp. UTMC 2448]GGS30196.1 hypothetical protein GCM10010171_24620 [Actinokineospora fastidiosa]